MELLSSNTDIVKILQEIFSANWYTLEVIREKKSIGWYFKFSLPKNITIVSTTPYKCNINHVEVDEARINFHCTLEYKNVHLFTNYYKPQNHDRKKNHHHSNGTSYKAADQTTGTATS